MNETLLGQLLPSIVAFLAALTMVVGAFLFAIKAISRRTVLVIVSIALLVVAASFLLPGQKTLRELQATPTLTTPIPGQQG